MPEFEDRGVDEPETVTITKEEYNSLLRQAHELSCLHQGGVDNWEWYSDSLRDGGFFDDEEDL